jgi:membrane protease YdiL (CAAX protease family)
MFVNIPSYPVIIQTLRRPVVLVFGLLWIASALAIALLGGWELFVARLPPILFFWFMAFLTLAITRPAPTATVDDPAAARKARLQLAFILIMIVLTAIHGLVFHRVIPEDSPLAFTFRLGQALGLLANPVFYFILPLTALLLLGANFRELGFGRGQRVWRVTALWCAVPLIYWGIGLAGGSLAIGALLRELANNAIQNGFFEEFLFRGALQTRLRLLTSPTTAIIVTSLVFGLWHLGLGFSEAGSLPGAIAVCIYSTAAYGLGFSIIMERTRNLLAPSIVHVVTNAF